MTLVTYIIFKFRYSVKSKKSDDTYELEGSFFRRYAPHIHRENEKILAEKNLKELNPKKRRKKLVWTYGGLTLIIFTFFLLENHLSFRRELMDRVGEAKTYKNLLQQGLLQKRELNPYLEVGEIEENIPTSVESFTSNLVSLLSKETIYIVRTKSTRSKHPTSKALSNWKEFLKRNKLKWKYSSLNFNKKGIYILPQLNELSDNEYKRIKQAIDHEKSKLFLTGPAGKSNTDGKTRKDWLGSNLVKLISNKESKTFFPTQLKGIGAIPPGLKINWVPLNNNFKYENDISGPLSESTYQGHPQFDSSGYKRILPHPRLLHLNKDTTLSLLDPVEVVIKEGETADPNYKYSDLFLLRELAILANIEFSETPTWRYGQINSIVSLSVDTEEDFRKIEILTELFEKHEVSATLFLVSDLMKENMSIMKDLPPKMELASHTSGHKPLKDRKIKDVFDDIQQSRHAIEEVSLQKVSGFRPPEEVLGDRYFSPVYQNEIDYVFGNQAWFRYSPLAVSKNNYIYIPRTIPDDFNITKNKVLSTPELISSYMKSHFEHVKDLNGGYFFSSHTHVFSSAVGIKAFDFFIRDVIQSSEGTLFWTLKEVSRWWKIKNQIASKIVYIEKVPHLEVKNNSIKETGEFEQILYTDESKLGKCNNSLNYFKANKRDGSLVVNIQNLEAKKEELKPICLN